MNISISLSIVKTDCNEDKDAIDKEVAITHFLEREMVDILWVAL